MHLEKCYVIVKLKRHHLCHSMQRPHNEKLKLNEPSHSNATDATPTGTAEMYMYPCAVSLIFPFLSGVFEKMWKSSAVATSWRCVKIVPAEEDFCNATSFATAFSWPFTESTDWPAPVAWFPLLSVLWRATLGLAATGTPAMRSQTHINPRQLIDWESAAQ